MFQSTPDLVNRENHRNLRDQAGILRFQSTPDLVNRENAITTAAATSAKRFQSTPDLVNRENDLLIVDGDIAVSVSIHSRFS